MAVDGQGRNDGLELRDYYVRWGFREVGRMERVGFKFERW
jgi:L-amino acid N-acyltransferase YncA